VFESSVVYDKNWALKNCNSYKLAAAKELSKAIVTCHGSTWLAKTKPLKSGIFFCLFICCAKHCRDNGN
jgi:hypothetical protein